ncbi:hypothetical protein FC83_GL000763 [Agrilactobacillus composti DSM 18527 = JCM 14202]|uniref:Uncharacterized protein n=1 Tax=Agrilactobacillus composti DSM 18527 = JCM 14202 TaxID=1423734 RepID=X0QP74_9LACO|nr:hypothetical protein [Agrilactobacillus composti]KRM31467.1 hypothetical protein FC83_GL000763 [Agrilactobacillus composti DSM 18527 = JCM 14202]GAF40425.1 hypothetical protein JCM14202_2322 [Agrilactobacillus composti DSM 18527 = JCM 14202]
MDIVQTVKPIRFIGKPYLASMLDENGSLTSAWQEMTASGALGQLDQLADNTGQEKNRTTLVVFSPYAFVAWVGALLPLDTKVPAGLNRLDLPESQAAILEASASVPMLQLPLSSIISLAMGKIAKQGVSLPEHLGQTDKPYFLERYALDDNLETIRVKQQVYLGQENSNGDETYLD